MMIHNPYRQLSLARVGRSDEKWHWITTSSGKPWYSDCVYHNGAFYAMYFPGGVHRYTIDGCCATRDVIFKDTFCVMYNMYSLRPKKDDVLAMNLDMHLSQKRHPFWDGGSILLGRRPEICCKFRGSPAAQLKIQ
jgi:ribosomal protein L31